MNRTKRFSRGRLLATALAAATLVGCAAKKVPPPVEPTTQPEPSNAIVVIETIQRRVRDLRFNADALAEVNKRLPGRTVTEDNQLVAEALGYLAAALGDIGGTDPDGAQRQQVQIVSDAQNQLLSAPAEVAEPTIDSALRAAYNSLSGLHRKHFRGIKEIGDLVEQLRLKLPRLDKAHDPLKRTPVSEVFNGISQVLQGMTRVMEAHAMAPYPNDPAPPPPSTAPATAPSTSPTSGPTSVPATRNATRPASAPATMPAKTTAPSAARAAR